MLLLSTARGQLYIIITSLALLSRALNYLLNSYAISCLDYCSLFDSLNATCTVQFILHVIAKLIFQSTALTVLKHFPFFSPDFQLNEELPQHGLIYSPISSSSLPCNVSIISHTNQPLPCFLHMYHGYPQLFIIVPLPEIIPNHLSLLSSTSLKA